MPRKRRDAASAAPDDGLHLHMTFRISADLRDRLATAAGDRPIGEEIRKRLEASFEESPAASADPRFADLLSSLTRVAVGAARMYPPRQFEYRSQTVEDISAYWVFEAATYMLLDAFRPFGFPDSLPKDAIHAEVFRSSERLVAAALGVLGDRGILAFDRLAGMDQEGILKAGFKLPPEEESQP